jgi:ubiquinone/menaquinone biosynthesis C-methylase UbiE
MSALDTLLGAVGETVRPGDRVLELGCGGGRFTGELAARAASLIAFDPSPAAIDRADERHGATPNVVMVQGDGETLEGVEDGAVDLVVVHGLFRRLASAKAQLGYVVEAGRVLAPGGRAVFLLSTDPTPPAPPAASRRDLLRAVTRRPDPAPAPFVPLDALGAAAQQGGLALDRIEGAGTKDTVALALRPG